MRKILPGGLRLPILGRIAATTRRVTTSRAPSPPHVPPTRLPPARVGAAPVVAGHATGPALAVPSLVHDPSSDVPYPVRVGAALSWRLLVIAGAMYVIGYLVIHLSLVVIPVAIALLLAALLSPAVEAMVRRGVPRGLSAAVVLVAGLAAVGGVLTFVVRAFIAGVPQMQEQVTESIGTIRDWLVSGPFQLSEEELDDAVESLTQTLADNQERLTSGALSTVTSVGHFITGFLLALFTLIFFLYDGRNIWSFAVRIIPRAHRQRADLAGQRSFASLVGYVRASVLVAIVDALGIGLGLFFCGVPLVVPLAALVFLGAFVPIVGAVIAGAVAVLVALVTQGPIIALIVLAVVIAVQQLEGHVLQPVLMGRAVALHPLAVVLAVAAGFVVAGIVGALLAVPLVAVLNAGIRSLVSEQEDTVDPAVVTANDPVEGAPPGEGRDESTPADSPAKIRAESGTASGTPSDAATAPADPAATGTTTATTSTAPTSTTATDDGGAARP